MCINVGDIFICLSFEGLVQVKATDANILAGKEPEHTMQFLALFCLGAIWHLAATLPTEDTKKHQSEESKDPPSNFPAEVLAPVEVWTTEMAIASSIDGEEWKFLGNFSGNVDASSVIVVILPQPELARYLKLMPLKWNIAPAIKCSDIFGCLAIEVDTALNQAQEELVHYLTLIVALLNAGELIQMEAKVKWRQAKDSQREKQAEMNHLVMEIDSLKSEREGLKAELEKSVIAVEKVKREKEEMDLKLQTRASEMEALMNQLLVSDELCKKTKGMLDTITIQNQDLKSENGHFKQQYATAVAQLSSLEKSRDELTILNDSLRNQLSSKVNGVVEEEKNNSVNLAALSAEVQSLTIEWEESKRTIQRMEKNAAEILAEKEELIVQVKELQLDVATREEQLQMAQSRFKSEINHVQRQLATAESSVLEGQARQNDLEMHLQKANATVISLQAELESTKTRLLMEKSSNEVNEKNQSMQNALMSEAEKRFLSVQTQQVRLQADNERLEAKLAAAEEKLKQMELKVSEHVVTMELLMKEKKQLEELEEELQLQLQVVAEERDSARQKEEILFFENSEKDQEIERIRDGYGIVI
jgi:chromosome segregation ATPase